MCLEKQDYIVDGSGISDDIHSFTKPTVLLPIINSAFYKRKLLWSNVVDEKAGLQYFAGSPIKRWSLFSHRLIQGWSPDMLYQENMVKVTYGVLKPRTQVLVVSTSAL